MHRQMQCRILDGLQRRQHRLFVLDGTFLAVRLGRFTGQGNLVDQVPFHRIGKGGFQQGVDFVDGVGTHPFFGAAAFPCGQFDHMVFSTATGG